MSLAMTVDPKNESTITIGPDIKIVIYKKNRKIKVAIDAPRSFEIRRVTKTLEVL